MRSLCDYCKYQKKCILTINKKEIFDCTEYSREVFFTDISTSATIEPKYSRSESSNGLCKNCDFENSCSLKEFGTVIFNCEQYQ